MLNDAGTIYYHDASTIVMDVVGGNHNELLALRSQHGRIVRQRLASVDTPVDYGVALDNATQAAFFVRQRGSAPPLLVDAGDGRVYRADQFRNVLGAYRFDVGNVLLLTQNSLKPDDVDLRLYALR